MAITKSLEHDKIECVGKYRAVQVREATVFKEDGTELSRSFRRYVLQADSDISDETAEIQAVCNAVWTDEIKAAWTAYRAAQAEEIS